MMKNGLVDGVIKEPLGGAHVNPDQMFRTFKKEVMALVNELKEMDSDERIEKRIEKFCAMGVVDEL